MSRTLLVAARTRVHEGSSHHHEDAEDDQKDDQVARVHVHV
jgi:hypothetical protein